MKNNLKKRRGFTLIELMTATTIMIILVLFVTNIAVDMLRAYDNTIAALSTNSAARTVLDPLQEDLNSAKMFNDGNAWFEVRYEDAVGNVLKTGAPNIMCFAQARDRIKRASINNAKTQIQGDLCAISYRFAQQSPFGEKASKSPENLVYAVYRSVLNAKDTYGLALPYVLGSGKSSSEKSRTPSAFWKSSEPITDPADQKKYTPEDWTKQIQNFLVDGVLDLSLIFWYDDFSDGKRKILVVKNKNNAEHIRNAFSDYEITTFSKSLTATAGTIILDDNFSNKQKGALRSVDVSITVISPEGKNILAGIQRQVSAGKIPDERFEDVLLKHGVTFTRSIKLFGE